MISNDLDLHTQIPHQTMTFSDIQQAYGYHFSQSIPQ